MTKRINRLWQVLKASPAHPKFEHVYHCYSSHGVRSGARRIHHHRLWRSFCLQLLLSSTYNPYVLLTSISSLSLTQNPTEQLFEPYFSAHPERNTYVTLLQKTDPPASDSLLKSALVRRAMADVQRVLKIREDKPALQNLLQKGSIGDDLWNSLLAAEKELEAEIMEVVAEANSFVEGWGQVIFPTANEMLANEKMRAVFERTAEAKLETGVYTYPFTATSILTCM